MKLAPLFLALAALLNCSLVCGQVPETVSRQIRANAASEHPNDYSTQEYVIKDQSNSYLLVQKLAASLTGQGGRKIVENARRDHPNDYSTQAYVIKSQVAAAERLGANLKEPENQKPKLPSAKDFISRVERVGLFEELSWQKSRVEEGWISQLRCYNGKAGKKLSLKQLTDPNEKHNETNCQFTGPAEDGISGIRIEAEVYAQAYAKDTIDTGVKVIDSMFDSPPLNDAFSRGENKSGSWWKVEKKPHPKGGGYDIVATISLRPMVNDPEGYFESAKKYVEAYVTSKAKASSHARFHYKADKVKYLGGQNFSVTGSVDDEESSGEWVERRFTCVIKMDGNNWKTVSIERGAWKRLD